MPLIEPRRKVLKRKQAYGTRRLTRRSLAQIETFYRPTYIRSNVKRERDRIAAWKTRRPRTTAELFDLTSPVELCEGLSLA